jgi:hypothetical protein
MTSTSVILTQSASGSLKPARRVGGSTSGGGKVGVLSHVGTEEMLRQKAGGVPVPWERTLLAFLEIVEGQELDWWLCGSAALAVRGLAVSPNDVDLNVAETSALRLGELLADCLVEPVQRARG